MPFAFWGILLILLGAAVGYLLGSVSFAVVFTQLFKHTDVREHGSGNAGMTNVLRTAGVLPGILTFVCDFLKAVLAVCFGRYLLIPMIQGLAPIGTVWKTMEPVYGAYICGIACFLGHIYPIFFSFKGGKGVVTAIGTILFIDWRIFLVVFGAFLVMLSITKIVSISSLTGAMVYPISTYLLYPIFHKRETAFLGVSSRVIETVFAAMIGTIVIFKHRENIKRLLKGEEKPLSRKKRAG